MITKLVQAWVKSDTWVTIALEGPYDCHRPR